MLAAHPISTDSINPSGNKPRHKSLVLLPSYNSGIQLSKTIHEALAEWKPVWVIIDASNDGSTQPALELAKSEPALKVLVRKDNGGKGSAVLYGLQLALAEGFTHALVMDADGQHPSGFIRKFMQLAEAQSNVMVLGAPIFGSDAPKARVYGRHGGNIFTDIETLWGGIRDSLFGFRVYPVKATVEIMEKIQSARRYDFDTEVVVRLYWQGFKPINVQVPVHYPSKHEGGISHFRYLSDNLLLIRTHAKLLVLMIPRIPQLLKWTLFPRN
ncbi:MAG: glycosyltransferase family 2 protein [Blastochloris sp.]|nr:glycosyltransferase family 2 protein [Blastochloris sp.]